MKDKDKEPNRLFYGKMSDYDYSKKPTFLEVWSVITEDDDNRVSKKLRKRVQGFSYRAFTARLAYKKKSTKVNSTKMSLCLGFAPLWKAQTRTQKWR